MGGFEVPQKTVVINRDESTIILPFVKPVGSTVLNGTGVLNSYTFSVDDATGMAPNQHIRIVDNISNRFYFGNIVSINVLQITVDTQLDFAYLDGSEVTFSTKNLAVNGGVTPVIFQGRTGAISIPARVDINKIIISCQATSAVDLSLFGNLPVLTRGLAMRVIKEARQNNIFNVKTNLEITNLAYDFVNFQASNPAQGVDGFKSQLTFSGKENLDTVLRLEQNDNIQILVQDDLSLLTELIVTLEGKITID